MKIASLTPEEIELMDYNEIIGLVKETNRIPGGRNTVFEIINRTCLNKESKVLEIGTSTGFTSIEISRFIKCNIKAIDINEDSLNEAKKILTSIECPIKIAGGPFATHLHHDLLKYCDYVFLGEAESNFSQFLELIDNGNFDKNNQLLIKGICYKDGETIQKNQPLCELTDLDKTPLSGWLFVSDYFRISEEVSPMWHLKPSMINILSSRGCNNNCVFCLSSSMHGRTPRLRSIEGVEEEIKLIDYLRKKQELPRLESIMLDDSDIFFRDRSSLEKLFFMFKRHELTYSAFASINNVDENLLKLGNETGLKTLFFGIETHERNRKVISSGKYFNDDKARYILEKCRANGIFTCTAFIIGFPWESREDISKTIECMDNLPSDYPGIGVLSLHPGTAVWKYKEQHLNLYSNTDSPHSEISITELDNFVKFAYRKAYSNPMRLNNLLSLDNQFDRGKALQTIERKRNIYS